MSLRIEREETFNAVVSIEPHAENFNIVSNDYGRTQKSYLSDLKQNYSSGANLVQQIKIVSLSKNLLPRLIRLCRIQWCIHFFVLDRKNHFWVNLVLKNMIVSSS